MELREAIKHKSTFVEFCASSSGFDVIKSIDAERGARFEDQLSFVSNICNSPISSEILFYLFQTVHSKVAFTKSSTKPLSVLQSLYMQCLIWHIFKLKSVRVVASSTLTNYINLFYMVNHCSMFKSLGVDGVDELKKIKIDGIETSIAKFFSDNNVEITSASLSSFFECVLSSKFRAFREAILKKQEQLEKKKHFEELLQLVKSIPALQQHIWLKMLEIGIVFLVLTKLFVH